MQINAQMQASQSAVMDAVRREGLPPDEASAGEAAPDQSLETALAVPSIPTAPPQGEAPALANVPS